jgi:hypothetical protein
MNADNLPLANWASLDVVLNVNIYTRLIELAFEQLSYLFNAEMPCMRVVII